MNYTISWEPNTEKFLDKLPIDIAERIVLKVNQIKDNPFHFLEHYEGADYYKLRVGEYRLLIDVDTKNQILRIQVIGHRKNIYK
jgi:mRNA interferase RelE/StbE